MLKTRSKENGFTLIEVIVVLVLVGISTALAGIWIVSVADGYLFARMNAGAAQKAQLAMTRMAKEFSSIQSVDTSATDDDEITYARADKATGGSLTGLTVSLSGSDLLLNGSVLTDSVASFELSYCDAANSTGCPITWTSTSRIIQITLSLMGGNNTPVEFTQRIAPRNI